MERNNTRNRLRAYTNINDNDKELRMFFHSERKEESGENLLLINIHKEAICNNTFRTVLWTGEHLQVTVMSIPVGGEIGLEKHDDLDQFIKIENGCAKPHVCRMGV